MAGKSQFALLKTRRFLPLFVTQALSAFNDNAFRYALSIILLTKFGNEHGGFLNTVSALLFIAPYFLLSAFAGQLADKYDKALVGRRIKLIEIGIVALSAFSLFTDIMLLQQFCILLAGAQAAFFGPIKYAILPQHLNRDELLGGNGMVEMATFVAVLLGTIFGTILIRHEQGLLLVAATMIGIAVFSYWTATQIPDAPSAQPDMPINWNVFSEIYRVIRAAAARPEVFQPIIGISWFWLLGVVFVTQIPLYTFSTLQGDERIATMIFALFSIGIAAGSVFSNRLQRGIVTVRYVPLAAVLMTIFMADLYFASRAAERIFLPGTETTPLGLLSTFTGWRVLFDLAAIAFCSGLYVVPLFAVMQRRTPYYLRARTIGANNIVNALFMMTASAISAVLLGYGITAKGIFLILAICNAIAAIYVIRLLPHEVFATVARTLFRFFYDVEIKGIEHVGRPGRRSLIVANHTSLLDGPLLSAFLPERAGFAIDTGMAKKWWVRPAFALFDLCPINPGNALALRSLVDMLRKGRKVVIFPEGRITVTGSLMKIYEGPAAVAEMARGQMVPVRIDGAQYSPFTRLKGIFPTRAFPKITITFLPPVKPSSPANLRGAALREHQAERLYDVMTDSQFRTAPIDQTLWEALLRAKKLYGGKRLVLEDIQRKPANYNRLFLGSFILGRKIAAATPGEKHVGVLLPNSIGTVVTFFALQAHGRVPAMLNFSTGAVNMAAACMAAEVRTILTSRKFIEAGEMENDVKLLGESCRILYLEDIRESVTTSDKLIGLFEKNFAPAALHRHGAATDPNSPAVILFTSGSEGVPKGVVLSHRNLLANWQQASARIAFTPQDKICNPLPVFHAFGMLAGMILPLMTGTYTFHYPSPLHYKIIPELCYDIGATVLFGTDTFLAGYAKNAHPYDFFNMRLVVAGAERLKPETRAVWSERFGLRILEGYGATECSPAVAFNTPMHNRNGTVGRLFDGIDYRIEPVEGIEEGGRLHVKGPNIMLGYLRADNPGVLEPPPDGWYDTGDIVSVDERRFITILGRAKRFCKIGGEMVSLNAIESKLGQLYPDKAHAVVAVPDKKKGEQLVYFTTLENPDRKQITEGLRKLGSSELMIPKNIFTLAALPVLGTGKIDYVAMNRMAREKVPE
ncbi:MAG: acyl-[ACP]--phospholipid O-acyltransferase [Proteobacteria bacterium]|nr:acyl-[ACP]--phospholipid O-acyltransferase [Pseudomonadota bacterium]